jgi:anti-sigma regulatory factor (Ser/Thr protein kinase)
VPTALPASSIGVDQVVLAGRGYALEHASGDRDRVGRRLELPPVLEAAGAARGWSAPPAARGVDGELCHDAQLIVTELVTNVVDHPVRAAS